MSEEVIVFFVYTTREREFSFDVGRNRSGAVDVVVVILGMCCICVYVGMYVSYVCLLVYRNISISSYAIAQPHESSEKLIYKRKHK